MKKGNLKRLLALGLATCMFVLTACGGSDKTAKKEIGPTPDYINLESFRPIVKEGEEITLSVTCKRDVGCYTAAEDTWVVNFFKEKLNVNLDVKEIAPENVTEQKNLMLTSGDLPDMMFGITMTNSNIVAHGVEGELFLPISDYFSEELTPNIMKAMEEYPEIAEQYTAIDGKMYTLPAINATYEGGPVTYGRERLYVDTRKMEAAGIEKLPDTLDELLDMLRAFKKLDPDSYPLIAESPDRLYAYLRTIFGWVGDNISTACWDEEEQEVVIPCLTEKYADYVELLNTLYTEGLLHPDFYTMDNTRAKSLCASASMMAVGAPYLVTSDWDKYVAMSPVTSEFCSKKVSYANELIIDGDVFISADTEYPELCVRLLDYMYSAEGSTYLTYGPAAGSEDCLDLVDGFYVNDENRIVIKDVENGTFDSYYYYQLNMLELGNCYSTINDYGELEGRRMTGIENPEMAMPDRNTMEGHSRMINYEAQHEYLVRGLPEAWMSTEDAERYTDLGSVISDYVNGQTARFVVGQRKLKEMKDFSKELEKMNGDEYLELARKAYANYKPE